MDHLTEQAHNLFVCARAPTAHEIAATIVFHDRYVATRAGAIEFWRTLTAPEQDWIIQLVRAVADAGAEPDPLWPRCPKRCDVATRPESVGHGRWVCAGCGSEFSWPVVRLAAEPHGPTDDPHSAANVLPFPA